MMRTIIAGSRNIHDYDLVVQAVNASGIKITEVISGNAAGIDTLAIQYAIENNLPIGIFPADWDTHGRKAGPLRNAEMAENADALIAIWDGKSRGTASMINIASRKKLSVYVYYVRITPKGSQ
jgi:predicted Rossmann fold nucleotide-binding protein DprA/Smf involved in DNA uptake